MVAPCRGFQPAEATLAEFVNQVLPVVTFALSEPQLSPADQAELREIKEKFSLPIFFFRVPEPGSELISPKKPDKDKSSLYFQLLDLGYLSPSSPCGSVLVEQPEKLRLLSTFSRQVLQKHLVEAATRLSEVHCRCLDIFINQAFDMQRDLQITPKRLEYTRRKENELYESLMGIANRKQEEMKDMIVETLGNMKEELLEDAASMEFRGDSRPERGGEEEEEVFGGLVLCWGSSEQPSGAVIPTKTGLKDAFPLFSCRHHHPRERGTHQLQGHQMLHQTNPGADHFQAEPSGGQQADQLRGLSEGELRGDSGEVPEEPGGVLGGFGASRPEFGEAQGHFRAHHEQLSQTGAGLALECSSLVALGGDGKSGNQGNQESSSGMCGNPGC